MKVLKLFRTASIKAPGLAGTEWAIEAGDLVKTYGKRTVVKVDSLRVMAGEVLAVLGPNGAGKSTLFRILALLEKPDQGWVKYFGKEVNVSDLAARRRTAAVFQRPILFQGTVRKNVEFGLRFRRLGHKEVCRRVDRVLELVGLASFEEADVRTLSGGELQRVALARALVVEPEILFLDEPTSNLDIGLRRRFREDLRRIVEALASTVVLITHDQAEALALADRVAVLSEGTVVQVGTPEEVFLQPKAALVADLCGAETTWRGTVVSNREGLCTIRTRAGILVDVVADLSPGDEAVLSIRPEDVSLSLAAAMQPGEAPGGSPGFSNLYGMPPSSVRNRWLGEVAKVVAHGALVRAEVRLDGSGKVAGGGMPVRLGGEGEVICVVTRASAEELGLRPGLQVLAGVKAAAISVIPEKPSVGFRDSSSAGWDSAS
ncbi:MAG: ABC transporter ATP-binding protein [Thermoleophilia bacterium]|nr:ABC transporter ATP-binding protein [Thermoleophilia bacterium]